MTVKLKPRSRTAARTDSRNTLWCMASRWRAADFVRHPQRSERLQRRSGKGITDIREGTENRATHQSLLKHCSLGTTFGIVSRKSMLEPEVGKKHYSVETHSKIQVTERTDGKESGVLTSRKERQAMSSSINTGKGQRYCMMVTTAYAKMWKGLIERLLAFVLPESLQPIPKSHHGPQGPRYMYPYPVLGAFCFLHRCRLDSWLHIANSDSDSFTAGTPAMCGHAQGENCMNKTATLCEFVKNMLLSGSVAWSLSARKIFLTCLQHKINTFVNDHATVSLKWLLDQVIKRGLDVGHLLRVKHKATGAIQTKEVQSASKEESLQLPKNACEGRSQGGAVCNQEMTEDSRGESLMHLMRGAPGSIEVCATTCASPRRLVLYSHFLAHARTLPISTTPNNTKGAPPPLSGLHRQRQEHPHVEAECIRAAALRKAGIEPHNTIDRYPQPVKHPARIVAGKWPPRRSSGVASSRASSIDCISVYPLALEGIDLFDHPLARRIAVGHVAACVYVLYLKGMAPIDTPDVFPLKLTGMCEVEDVLPEPQLSILSV
ncbi:hypothetical protein DFH08DRAFT_827001 [Mycena albidolilacea]|uniref:Uncharacterized protein n=1 Tax=Mycena albidolilacea TaxID=1033008 RepID=A0AAD6YZB2_9AGAR|nr:hypothetical protein DFH08DRAFT_827001 [Mycena albidolilacea]